MGTINELSLCLNLTGTNGLRKPYDLSLTAAQTSDCTAQVH